jgi:hypothetical protein
VSPSPSPTSGTDVYTDDSDLVAVLVHTGHVKLKTVGKTPLLVSLRVCPAQATYTGSERNGLSSRDWTGKHGGVSIKVERCLQHTAGSAPALSGGGLRGAAVTPTAREARPLALWASPWAQEARARRLAAAALCLARLPTVA